MAEKVAVFQDLCAYVCVCVCVVWVLCVCVCVCMQAYGGDQKSAIGIFAICVSLFFFLTKFSYFYVVLTDSAELTGQ